MPRGALRIRDLGFLALGVFAALSAQGVHWLSRLALGSAVYTTDGERWDVLDLLAVQGTPTVDLRGNLPDEAKLALLEKQRHDTAARQERDALNKAQQVITSALTPLGLAQEVHFRLEDRGLIVTIVGLVS